MSLENGLEAALASTQVDAEAVLKASAALSRELKKVRSSAVTGQVRDLRKALDAAVTLSAELAEATRRAQSGFEVDEVDYLSSGGYAKELLALAAVRGVAMFEEDERLLCYPSLLRLLPGDAAVEIDRRREKRLRPSVVVDALAAAQQRPPRFKAETFLESLAGAYALLAQDGPGVQRLIDVWDVLTLLPGQAKDYTKPEFARDLYLLDQSGVTATKSGRTLRWHASSGTRGASVLTTVAKTGQQQRYWGVSFT
jgi:hypothetical protein